MLREVTVSLPPKIAGLGLAVPPEWIDLVRQATQAVTVLDRTRGRDLGVLSALLLRAESVASSKIERVEASMDDFARALHGNRSNESATSMVASTTALETMINSTNDGAPLTLEAILSAHEILMRDDPEEQSYAGRIRDVQNWIGGSDWSPRNALFVPPPPETVEEYLEDLLLFANRTDIDAFLQAAVAHAQFESIHPFADGNGRIGRALINAVLRKRGITTQVVVPLASAMVADKKRYFTALDLYRLGDTEFILMLFLMGAVVAAVESDETATRLGDLPSEWATFFAPRNGSTMAFLLDDLLEHPVFTVEEVIGRLGRSGTAVYDVVNELHDHAVIRPVTKRKRDQIWVVAPLVDELDDLNDRIAERVRSGHPKPRGSDPRARRDRWPTAGVGLV